MNIIFKGEAEQSHLTKIITHMYITFNQHTYYTSALGVEAYKKRKYSQAQRPVNPFSKSPNVKPPSNLFFLELSLKSKRFR